MNIKLLLEQKNFPIQVFLDANVPYNVFLQNDINDVILKTKYNVTIQQFQKLGIRPLRLLQLGYSIRECILQTTYSINDYQNDNILLNDILGSGLSFYDIKHILNKNIVESYFNILKQNQETSLNDTILFLLKEQFNEIEIYNLGYSLQELISHIPYTNLNNIINIPNITYNLLIETTLSFQTIINNTSLNNIINIGITKKQLEENGFDLSMIIDNLQEPKLPSLLKLDFNIDELQEFPTLYVELLDNNIDVLSFILNSSVDYNILKINNFPLQLLFNSLSFNDLKIINTPIQDFIDPNIGNKKFSYFNENGISSKELITKYKLTFNELLLIDMPFIEFEKNNFTYQYFSLYIHNIVNEELKKIVIKKLLEKNIGSTKDVTELLIDLQIEKGFLYSILTEPYEIENINITWNDFIEYIQDNVIENKINITIEQIQSLITIEYPIHLLLKKFGLDKLKEILPNINEIIENIIKELSESVFTNEKNI
jgi:hypothetical protein